MHGRIKADGSRQVMQTEVQPDTEFQEILYFFIPLCAAETFIEVGKDEFRHIEAQQAGNFTSKQFGDQGFWTLPGASKLKDIEEFIVRFGDGGQRPAFAKWCYVPGNINVAKHLQLS